MEAFLVQYGRYLWLGGSLIAALLIDYACVRLLLDWVRQSPVYVFWIGRAGKFVALVAWMLFFHLFWYPQYVGENADGSLKWIEVGIVLAFAAFAVITLPRFGARRREIDG